MGSRTIAVIGTINFDCTLVVERVPDPGESVKARGFRQSYGGKGANAAISSFRSCHLKPSELHNKGELNGLDLKQHTKAYPECDDVHVHLVAATGDDENGKLCRENLQNNGIDIDGVRVVPQGMTGMSFCVVEEDTGENRIISHRGANDSHEPKHFATLDNIAGGRKPDLLICHLTLPLPVIYQILETAGEAGVDILLNAAPAQNIARKLYKYLTHLIVNETEAAILTGRDVQDVTPTTCPDIAEVFLKKGAKNVVITLGKAGAYYAARNNEGNIDGGLVPGVVEVVDTTGAGDTFVGTYGAEYVLQMSQGNWNIRKAVVRASRASAYTIREFGAQSSIPWADQIDRVEPTTSDSVQVSKEDESSPPRE